MKLRSILFCFSLTLSLPGQGTLALKASRLWDGKSSTIISNAVVLIEGDHIVAVGSRLEIPKGCEVIDLGKTTLMPGLVDCHTHMLLHTDRTVGDGPTDLAFSVYGLSTTQRALHGAVLAREMLEAGFTSIRDLGNAGQSGDAALREAIDKGWVSGPRMQVCTKIIAPTGGQFGPLAQEARSLIGLDYTVIIGVEEARKAVRQAIYDGADFIKVVVSEEKRSLDLEELKAVVSEAHRAKLKVAAHAQKDPACRLAAEAGVDSIEHGNGISEATLRLMAKNRIYLVPTDMPASVYVAMYVTPLNLPPAQALSEDSYWKTREQANRERILLARQLGVPIAAGSDMFYGVDGKGRGDASKLMFRAYAQSGLTNLEVLKMATSQAADLLGAGEKIGTVAPGFLADLIAVKGNPIENCADLEQVAFVMKGGKVIRR